MMKVLLAIAATAFAAVSATVAAEVQNNVPSCYSRVKVMDVAPAHDTAIFVLIDQTTPLNKELRTLAEKNAYGYLMRNGGEFIVAQFSSFAQDHYMTVSGAGLIEPTVPEANRMSVSVPKLEKLDECLKKQKAYAGRMMVKLMDADISGASDQLAKSDIMASLKAFSDVVRSSPVPNKVVFVISDMLENSSVSSFYVSHGVRDIHPKDEMKLAESAGMIGDFGGAKVYIMGAGIVSEAGMKTGVYRDPKTMSALEEFWKLYFKKAGGTVAEFGTPALLRIIE